MALKQTARPGQAARPAPRPPKPPVARGHAAPGRRLRFKAPDFRFARDIIAELKKVTWPSAQQVRELTIVVLIISSVVGVILGGIDWVFSKLVEVLLLRPIF
ncbi:MAG: preprotein translocase subunit SecE [Chloroflexota bacterium]|nr:preprotein translocase subunit SecE [Dehalococcoidia bacterium]MDW8252338.1 preprotein translocase subunit SecE [Chloroflexota bacterium]